MTIIKRILMRTVFCTMIFFTACDLTTPYVFEVHFANDWTTDYSNLPLTGLYVRNQEGSWSESLIPATETLDPGEYLVFAVEIPEGDYLEYKIAVDHGNPMVRTELTTGPLGQQLSLSSSPVSVRACWIVVKMVGDTPEVTTEGGAAWDPLWGETEWEGNPETSTDNRTYTKVSWSPL